MKLGVRECVDVVLKAKSNVKIGTHVFRAGEPVLYFDSLKTSTMEGAATTVYATGGRGNAQLLAWEGEKTLTFTMEDALISPKGLAILTGAGLIQASDVAGKEETVVAHITDTIEVMENGKIVLNKAPSANPNAEMYVMLLDENGEMSGVPVKIDPANIKTTTAEGQPTVYTVENTLFGKGDIVMVDYYVDYHTDAVQIEISPDKFAGYYYFEGSTLWRRQSDGVDLPAEFIIPKVKVQSNFSFTLASEGDPSTFTFTMDAFADYLKFDRTKKVLAAIQVLSADDNYDLTGAENETGTVEYKRFSYGTDDGDYISAEGKVTTNDTDWTAPAAETRASFSTRSTDPITLD